MVATVTDSLRNWRTLPVGGGGFVTGFDQHTDGTLVCRSDVGGAYLWDAGTGRWNQIVTSFSMPSDMAIYYGYSGSQSGCAAIVIAPTNSSIFYMIFHGFVLKSVNRGANWAKCSGWTQHLNESNSGAQRLYNRRLAVDPLNANVVYVGTQDAGLFRTLDGGATFELCSDVPLASPGTTGTPGITGIIFDPTSGSASGRTSVLWAASHGSGYYQSTDGGDNWAKPASGPTNTVVSASFGSDGKLYCLEHAGTKLWRWDTSAWAELTATAEAQPASAVLVDPNDATRVLLAAAGGNMQESNDSGDTWGDLDFSSVSRVTASDVPWFANAYGTGNSAYMSCADMRFDVSGVANKILFAEGIGFWTTSITSGALRTGGNSYAMVWTSMSKGIENLVATQIVATPASTLSPGRGNLLLAAWDRPVFKINTIGTYPSDYLNRHFSGSSLSLDNCFGVDYLTSNPDEIAMVMGFDESGYSLDGGATITEFASAPAAWTGTSKRKGEIAVGGPGNYLWCGALNGGVYYTTDRGTTWNTPTFDPAITDTNAWNDSATKRRHILAADRVTPNKFYAYNYVDGIYVSTDSGANFTRVFTGLLMSGSGFHFKLRCPEGKAGHLWASTGDVGGTEGEAPSGLFKRSVDGGVTWSTIDDVLEVYDFDFGKAAPGASYPTIGIVGWVNGVYGVYYCTDASDTPGTLTWTKIAGFPNDNFDSAYCFGASKTRFGEFYIGFEGTSYAYTTGSISGNVSLQF